MAVAKPSHAEIRADAAYSLPDFQHITGMGAKSLRRAKAEGLRVERRGRRSYIIGQWWLDYLSRGEAAK
jgi:hypothetical protein